MLKKNPDMSMMRKDVNTSVDPSIKQLLKCAELFYNKTLLSHDMRFPTIWYVQPAKPQISLRIRAVWSEPLLVAWIFYEC